MAEVRHAASEAVIRLGSQAESGGGLVKTRASRTLGVGDARHRGSHLGFLSIEHMAIQRMEHVGIVVDDLAAATEFFVELALVLQGQWSVEGCRRQR